jgi:hypothetical protein
MNATSHTTLNAWHAENCVEVRGKTNAGKRRLTFDSWMRDGVVIVQRSAPDNPELALRRIDLPIWHRPLPEGKRTQCEKSVRNFNDIHVRAFIPSGAPF